MSDTAHNGKAFNIALADIPERKDYLVAGRYEVDAPAGKTPVAVKVRICWGKRCWWTAAGSRNNPCKEQLKPEEANRGATC